MVSEAIVTIVRALMIGMGIMSFAMSMLLLMTGLLNGIDRFRWHGEKPVLEYLIAGALCGIASVMFFYLSFM